MPTSSRPRPYSFYCEGFGCPELKFSLEMAKAWTRSGAACMLGKSNPAIPGVVDQAMWSLKMSRYLTKLNGIFALKLVVMLARTVGVAGKTWSSVFAGWCYFIHAEMSARQYDIYADLKKKPYHPFNLKHLKHNINKQVEFSDHAHLLLCALCSANYLGIFHPLILHAMVYWLMCPCSKTYTSSVNKAWGRVEEIENTAHKGLQVSETRSCLSRSSLKDFNPRLSFLINIWC